MKRLLAVCLAIIIAFSVAACSGRKEDYSSPNGENKITVEYDLVSRPHVIYNGDVIWKYEGSGFNEEVNFDVEWIDEDTIKLVY